jgi:hypothetical protein
MCCVRDRSACAHGGRHNGRFRELRVGRSSFSRLLGMNFDAIRALRGERDRNCHQLLVQYGDFTFLKHGLVEGLKSLHSLQAVYKYSLPRGEI